MGLFKRKKKNSPPREPKSNGTPRSPGGKKMEANLQSVPLMTEVLQAAEDTSGAKPTNALRLLFSVSEHASDEENRIQMIRIGNGRLAPALLDFLQRCEQGSSEQYLALLVLNNISIPTENKQVMNTENSLTWKHTCVSCSFFYR